VDLSMGLPFGVQHCTAGGVCQCTHFIAVVVWSVYALGISVASSSSLAVTAVYNEARL
jgi:hypothetical protein